MIKHMLSQPFVLATGVAALVHSTWALGTFFSGSQPESIPHLIGWLIPAFLVAFALDVGQIATASEIREHGLSPARAVTFLTFAAATFYLQFLYMAHHMPALTLSAGISPVHAQTAELLKSFSIWFIPALLPMSTLLYTFSSKRDEKHHKTPQKAALNPSTTISKLPTETLPSPTLQDVLDAAATDVNEDTQPVPAAKFTAECECGWSRDYMSEASAGRGLSTHQQKHCPLHAGAQVGLFNE